jgi:hypothetical protein
LMVQLASWLTCAGGFHVRALGGIQWPLLPLASRREAGKPQCCLPGAWRFASWKTLMVTCCRLGKACRIMSAAAVLIGGSRLSSWRVFLKAADSSALARRCVSA